MRDLRRECRAEWLAILCLVLVVPHMFGPELARASVGPELLAAGWREIPNPNKAENEYSAGPEGAIEVVSSNSVSTLYRPVDADISERPILTWRWRVDEAAPATDLARKGEDDCSLAVYVGFPYRSEQASFFERLKRPLVESWAGADAPGRVLRYVFCGREQRGTVVESPYLGSAGFMRILRPTDSPTGTWFTEQVDLAADYRQAFGEDPPDPAQIAIQADTDNTQSASRAMVAGLAFEPRDENARGS
jgi:hypothetical protein